MQFVCVCVVVNFVSDRVIKSLCLDTKLNQFLPHFLHLLSLRTSTAAAAAASLAVAVVVLFKLDAILHHHHQKGLKEEKEEEERKTLTLCVYRRFSFLGEE